MQGHLRFSNDVSLDIVGENSLKNVEDVKKWIDLFMEAGVKAAILHSGGRGIVDSVSAETLFEMRVDAIRELVNCVVGSDTYICLENLYWSVKDADSLLKIIEAVNLSNMGICLDTGHLNMNDGDQETFIKQAGDYLRALHIADNQGVEDQHLMPFGRGSVDWEKVVSGLKAIKYEHLFNFEIPDENKAPIELRMAKLEYIKEIYKYLLNC